MGRAATIALAVAAGSIAACGGSAPEQSPTRSVVPAQVVLTLATQGEGVVQGLSSDCRGTCSQKLPLGDRVTLKAVPDAGATFAGWLGACSGAAACTLALDSDVAVTAIFVRAQAVKRLAIVTLEGHGRVISSPPRIDCGTICAALFDDGQPVTLIAMPDAGYVFSGWSGTCSGTDPCSFTMVGTNAAVSAMFSARASTAPAGDPQLSE